MQFLDTTIRDGWKIEYQIEFMNLAHLERSGMGRSHEEKLPEWSEFEGGVGREDTRFCCFEFDFKESFRPGVK